MEALAVYSGEMVAIDRQELTAETMTSFIEWIDRSEGTTRTYIINLRQFFAWMLYTGTTAPARQDIILYRDWLTGEHDAIRFDPKSATGWNYRTDLRGNPVKVSCKPATVAQYVRSVCQFIRWAAATGRYTGCSVDHIRLPKVSADDYKKDALTPAEILTIETSIA